MIPYLLPWATLRHIHILESPKKRLWEWTFIEASPRMVSTGVATAEEVESVIAGMAATRENNRALAAQWPMVGAWAEK